MACGVKFIAEVKVENRIGFNQAALNDVYLWRRTKVVAAPEAIVL